eukprot:scaffold96165_cov31-Prasinocladus_malaysianus.AAC.1
MAAACNRFVFSYLGRFDWQLRQQCHLLFTYGSFVSCGGHANQMISMSIEKSPGSRQAFVTPPSCIVKGGSTLAVSNRHAC